MTKRRLLNHSFATIPYGFQDEETMLELMMRYGTEPPKQSSPTPSPCSTPEVPPQWLLRDQECDAWFSGSESPASTPSPAPSLIPPYFSDGEDVDFEADQAQFSE